MTNTTTTPATDYTYGPWVLLDRYGVVSVVDTIDAVCAFIDAQRQTSQEFTIDTVEHRCRLCGERTGAASDTHGEMTNPDDDRPHAPKCPATLTAYRETAVTLDDMLRKLRDHLNMYEITTDAETANDSAQEIATLTRILMDLLQPRAVDAFTVGVTIDGVDLHVKANDDCTTVSVGAEQAPDDRPVLVQDWSGVTWQHRL